MSKHTPGPWVINHRRLGWELAGYVPIDGVNHSALAHVVWVMQEDDDAGRHSPECEANARLIAAAPDLLAALWAMSTSFHAVEYMEPHMREAAQMARAAIAKATGESHD